MKHVHFIYNPASGENSVIEHLDTIVARYQKSGYAVSISRIDFAAPPQQLIESIDSRTDQILIAGGDGTINYVVNTLKANNIDCPIALLPSGTANDFASCMGMPADIPTALDRITNGTPHPTDLGQVNGVWFVNVLSCGLFTDVSQKTPTLLKNVFGRLAYYVNGINELPKFRNMQLNIHTREGFAYEGGALIMFVFNGRTAGGFPLSHLSSTDDGLLDLLIVKGRTPLEAAQTVIGYLHNIASNRYPESIIHVRTSSMHIDSLLDETTDIDGQPAPAFPLEIECVKGAVDIIC